MADRVGESSALLRPLVEALAEHVLSAEKLHADDTPVPVLVPGRGTTKQGRLWVYVRDDRPAAGETPPAAWCGRWSQYFDTSTWARRPGPASPFAIGRLGAGDCTTFEQRPHESFGLT